MTAVQLSSVLKGRGLWCGVQEGNAPFTMKDWDARCAEAASWGIQVIHPKVGDGAHLWYTLDVLKQMYTIAKSHKLQCVPYLYCYGDTFHALDWEAHQCAEVGNIFDGQVIADMEIQWQSEQAIAWAERFGDVLRHIDGYKGDIYVTSFANMVDHPLPWFAINSWCNGFLPQVYFDEWINSSNHMMLASEALAFVYKQWLAIDQEMRDNHAVLAPLYPIIELGRGIPGSEVIQWIEMTRGYGYCGFWYDGTYAPYAHTIQLAPIPGTPAPAPAPAPAPVMESKPAPVTKPVEAATAVKAPSQKLSTNEQRILWQSAFPAMVFSPESAIFRKWLECVESGESVGVPMHNEYSEEHDGEKMVWVTTNLNKQIIYFPATGTTVIL